MNTIFFPYPVKSTNSLLNYNPYLNSNVNYFNINKDVNLRKDVTKFFQKKIIKWINEDDNFKQYNSKLELIKSTRGQEHIYNLLRTYIKKSSLNWYDLRSNLYVLKDYFNKKL